MLKRPEAAAVLKEFVVATLYTDKHTQYRDVMNKRFRSIALPLYVILGPDGQERARLAGRINLPQFLEFLKKGRNEATSKIHSDFDSALAAAKARGRPALIEFADFTSSLSLVMKETVLKKPSVQDRLRKLVHARLYIDCGADGPENRRLLEDRFATLVSPSYMILSPEGVELARILGRATEGEYLQFLEKGLVASAKGTQQTALK